MMVKKPAAALSFDCASRCQSNEPFAHGVLRRALHRQCIRLTRLCLLRPHGDAGRIRQRIARLLLEGSAAAGRSRGEDTAKNESIAHEGRAPCSVRVDPASVPWTQQAPPNGNASEVRPDSAHLRLRDSLCSRVVLPPTFRSTIAPVHGLSAAYGLSLLR